MADDINGAPVDPIGEAKKRAAAARAAKTAEKVLAAGVTVIDPSTGKVATDAPPKVVLVNMKRDPARYPYPYTATVHPLEVDNFVAGGWEIDDGADGSAKV